MRLEESADTLSPWYEAFAPASAASPPAAWAVAMSEAPAANEPLPRGAGDEDWATEALFDWYNG